MAGNSRAKKKVEAVAYLRTSSAANVGEDRDSESRQRKAIAVYAKRAGVEIVESFYDAAVSGTDAIQNRPGFAALLDRIDGNAVRTVIVEDASRFARHLIAQELGIALLSTRGVRLLTAGGDDLTASDDPARDMVRQITGSFAQYERARLVSKLKSGRERNERRRANARAGSRTSRCAPTWWQRPNAYAVRRPARVNAAACVRSARNCNRWGS